MPRDELSTATNSPFTAMAGNSGTYPFLVRMEWRPDHPYLQSLRILTPNAGSEAAPLKAWGGKAENAAAAQAALMERAQANGAATLGQYA